MRTLLLTLIFLVALPVCGQRVRTTRGRLHRPVAVALDSAASVMRTCIVEPPDSGVVLAGFDKPLSSLSETVFVTNRLPYEIIELYLTLDYSDGSCRQLHSRSLKVGAVVPAGATRQVSFPSWDRQKSFYYHRSRRPRTLAAPFTVECRVDSVALRSGDF